VPIDQRLWDEDKAAVTRQDSEDFTLLFAHLEDLLSDTNIDRLSSPDLKITFLEARNLLAAGKADLIKAGFDIRTEDVVPPRSGSTS
jgi:hypothetical protein